MSTKFSISLETAGGLGITRELSLSSGRIICYTKFLQESGHWMIGASEGVTCWRAKLSEDDLEKLGDSKDEPTTTTTTTTILSDMCQTLKNGDIELLKSQNHLSLVLKCASKEIDLTLLESSAAERKLEINTLVFSLWDSLQTTRARLEVCEKDLLDVQKSKYDGGYGDINMATGGVGKASVSTRSKKTKGASLVNPNTKRRKAATGVVFDADN